MHWSLQNAMKKLTHICMHYFQILEWNLKLIYIKTLCVGLGHENSNLFHVLGNCRFKFKLYLFGKLSYKLWPQKYSHRQASQNGSITSLFFLFPNNYCCRVVFAQMPRNWFRPVIYSIELLKHNLCHLPELSFKIFWPKKRWWPFS